MFGERMDVRSPPVMDDRNIILRCYAYRAGSTYRGECVDLDLLVERDTLPDAVRALSDAVVGYVDAAHEQGWLDQLVPRRSPLSRRLKYRWMTLLPRVRRLIGELVETDRIVSFSDGRVSVA